MFLDEQGLKDEWVSFVRKQVLWCRPLKQSLSRKDVKCLTKLIVDSKSQKVVGCHMVGAEAAEIVQVQP